MNDVFQFLTMRFFNDVSKNFKTSCKRCILNDASPTPRWRWLWWGWWWKLTWSSSCSLQPGDGVSVSTADLVIFVSRAMIKISISMKIAFGALLNHNCSNLGLVFPAGSARLVWVSVSIRGSKLPSVRSLLIGSGLLDHNATKSLSYINATYFPPQQIVFFILGIHSIMDRSTQSGSKIKISWLLNVNVKPVPTPNIRSFSKNENIYIWLASIPRDRGVSGHECLSFV